LNRLLTKFNIFARLAAIEAAQTKQALTNDEQTRINYSTLQAFTAVAEGLDAVSETVNRYNPARALYGYKQEGR
jgi:hypothetical protein